MPFKDNASLPKGVKGLPEGQQTKWRKTFNGAYEGTCKDRSDKDECASRIAWGAIDDKYKKSALVEFSMQICSATHDKQQDTLRWKATASDTDEDFFHDNMSLELFSDFINRISIKELVPEEFRSSFWSGGEPYLSISHYPDMEGNAVPGMSDVTYIDGNRLKAKGTFNKSKLGLTCYHAICRDLYTEPKTNKPIRISIAFLDWGHVHKSNGYEFERECIDDICPECIKEHNVGEFKGKIFKKGQLVHYALTRVPANERTSMEVDKSMVTKKEDAISIVGEELADELDEKAKLTQRSEIAETSDVMVVKSEDKKPDAVVEETKPKSEKEDEEDEEEGKDCSKKKSTTQTEKYISEPVPVVVVDEPSEYKPFGGATSMQDARAYREAQKEQWRVSDLWWAFQAVMENILGNETIKDKTKAIGVSLKELKEMLGDKSVQMLSLVMKGNEEMSDKKHELDDALSAFKTAFDGIKGQAISPDEKLTHLQAPFNEFAAVVRNSVKEEPQMEQEPTAQSDIVKALSEVMQPLYSKMDLLLAKQSETVVKSNPATPVRRSIVPTLSMQQDIQPVKQIEQPQMSPLKQMVRKSVGLQ